MNRIVVDMPMNVVIETMECTVTPVAPKRVHEWYWCCDECSEMYCAECFRARNWTEADEGRCPSVVPCSEDPGSTEEP